MPIYNITKGNLIEISEIPFDLEREIQRLVESNMNTIFNLEFVDSEFELDGLRIDSLGFNQESKSFIIIEYKKERNFSVIDQGYAYLSLLLNNKAEFILKFNENKKEFLKKDGVDWSQSRVIFISPIFSTYQRKAIEFRDLPIELWEVKKYTNNTILFNQIQAPAKSESITTISQRSEIVKQVSREVRTYDEEYHFHHASDKTKSIYNELKNSILSFGTNISVKPVKMYIAFVRKSTFTSVILRKSHLTIIILMKKGSLVDPKNITRDKGHGYYEIKISDSTELGYIMTLIKQAYDNN
jgi:predicted transport protein